MSWNYRLVVTAEDENDRDVTICEVYYDKDGNPNGYVDTAPPSGSTPTGTLAAYDRMRDAFNRPVLRQDHDGHLVEVDWETERSWS